MSAEYCNCGCGELAPRRPVGRAQLRGFEPRTGEPYDFIKGHQARKTKAPACGYVKNDETGCWDWKLYIDPDGYGMSNRARAHRVVWEAHRGPIPEGLQLDHLCRNRACVNPDHLEPVTPAENVRRGDQASLTMEQAEAIRDDTRTSRVIAEEFGVTMATVQAVWAYRVWVP